MRKILKLSQNNRRNQKNLLKRLERPETLSILALLKNFSPVAIEISPSSCLSFLTWFQDQDYLSSLQELTMAKGVLNDSKKLKEKISPLFMTALGQLLAKAKNLEILNFGRGVMVDGLEELEKFLHGNLPLREIRMFLGSAINNPLTLFHGF